MKNINTRLTAPPTKENIRCHCGANVVLRSSEGIYSKHSEAELLYVCSRYPECDSYARVHPGTDEPMSTLADSDLRYLRKMTHHYFNQIYTNNIMGRSGAYNWLAMTLKLPKYMAHIGYLDSGQCERLIEESKKLLELMGITPQGRFVRTYGGRLDEAGTGMRCTG